MFLIDLSDEGDVVIQTDISKTFINNGTGTGNNTSHWTELATPTDAVTSVNSQTGAVTVTDTNYYLTGLSLSGSTLTATVNGTSDQDVSLSSLLDDTNTTYDFTVPSGTTSLRLDPSSGSNDDIALAGGTGISITRNNANQLTITNTAPDQNHNTDTNYYLSDLGGVS